MNRSPVPFRRQDIVVTYGAPVSFWGPDLSDTLQGAGGVGGLLAVTVGGQFYIPGYDNNGNVVGHWDEVGDLVAEYACDAFGNTMSSSGTMADIFPHRFSTKYYDAEADLYYYGYRRNSPSRDKSVLIRFDTRHV